MASNTMVVMLAGCEDTRWNSKEDNPVGVLVAILGCWCVYCVVEFRIEYV
jgi:hypothetical protein